MTKTEVTIKIGYEEEVFIGEEDSWIYAVVFAADAGENDRHLFCTRSTDSSDKAVAEAMGWITKNGFTLQENGITSDQ